MVSPRVVTPLGTDSVGPDPQVWNYGVPGTYHYTVIVKFVGLLDETSLLRVNVPSTCKGVGTLCVRTNENSNPGVLFPQFFPGSRSAQKRSRLLSGISFL